MSIPTDDEVAAKLWARLARPFVLAEVVDALLGLSTDVVEQLAGVMIATCDEAGELLRDAPMLVRNLTTSVATVAVRTRGEVRGPVLWSETISARAATSGDTDLFVCKAPQRDYDTPENQVLVQSLAAIADAGASVEKIGVEDYDDHALRMARARAHLARKYLAHPALGRVTRAEIKERTLKRAKGGKKGQKYQTAFAMLERATEPLAAVDVAPFCDRRTRLQHRILVAVIEELERRQLTIPAMRVEGGILLAGPVTYIHPRRLRTRDHLHGIVIGNTVIDVPERFRGTTRQGAAEALAYRVGSRQSVLVVDESEVAAAVDLAVLDAREQTRHLGS